MPYGLGREAVCDILTNLISAGLSFVRVAQACYDLDDRVGGDEARAKAEVSHNEAMQYVEALPKSKRARVSLELTNLRNAIDHISGPEE